jgi:hypothetical protein
MQEESNANVLGTQNSLIFSDTLMNYNLGSWVLLYGSEARAVRKEDMTKFRWKK